MNKTMNKTMKLAHAAWRAGLAYGGQARATRWRCRKSLPGACSKPRSIRGALARALRAKGSQPRQLQGQSERGRRARQGCQRPRQRPQRRRLCGDDEALRLGHRAPRRGGHRYIKVGAFRPTTPAVTRPIARPPALPQAAQEPSVDRKGPTPKLMLPCAVPVRTAPARCGPPQCSNRP